MRRSTLGLEHGQDSVLIRGLALAFAERGDLDENTVAAMLADRTPSLLIARAREVKRNERISAAAALARVITRDHDQRMRSKRRAA